MLHKMPKLWAEHLRAGGKQRHLSGAGLVSTIATVRHGEMATCWVIPPASSEDLVVLF